MHGERLFFCQSIRRAGQIIGFCPAIVICAYKSVQGIKHQIVSKDTAFMTSERFCLFLMLLLIRLGFAHFNEAYYSPQYHPAEGKEKILAYLTAPHAFPCMHRPDRVNRIHLSFSHLATVIITLF